MKALLALFIGLTSLQVSAARTYTEEEFVKKVNAEVKKKVDTIKNKSVSELTKELLDKEEKLKLRELELQKTADALKVSEADLGKRYTDLNEKQKAFIGCVEKNEDEAKARIGSLVDMISNMKPQKAAEVISVQEADIAVRILQTIDSKKASKIFNFMDKEISAKLQKQYLLMKKI
jgi:flagellar motility protein MotE (MotC chaperone)